MHLAGVGASPSSDSLALSHLGDDSWWHLPLVPRPPGSEAITVVNQTEFTILSVKTATPKKQKKKETGRACRCIYIYIYCTTYLFGVYTSLTYLSIDSKFTTMLAAPNPSAANGHALTGLWKPSHQIGLGPRGFEGADFFGEKSSSGNSPKKKTNKL